MLPIADATSSHWPKIRIDKRLPTAEMSANHKPRKPMSPADGLIKTDILENAINGVR